MRMHYLFIYLFIYYLRTVCGKQEESSLCSLLANNNIVFHATVSLYIDFNDACEPIIGCQDWAQYEVTARDDKMRCRIQAPATSCSCDAAAA